MFRQKEVYLAAFLFLLFTTIPVHAEIATWAHSFGDGESDFYAKSMQTTSGNFDAGLMVVLPILIRYHAKFFQINLTP
jgi:hypothetical protein